MKRLRFTNVHPSLKKVASGAKAPVFLAVSARLKPRHSSISRSQFVNALFVAAAWMSLVCVGMGVAVLRAQNKPAASKVQQAAPDPTSGLPHDNHDGLTIIADPWTDKVRSKDKFGKANPLDAGVLPVEVFLRNATDYPIQVNLNTVQLEVHLRNGRHQDIDWLSAEDVAALIAHPGGAAPSQPRRIAGIPLPNGDKKAEKFAEILRPLTLDSDTVSPMGSLHGFLYFDVSHDPSLADTSLLYVPDVVVLPTKKTLMFFEVPLGKSAKP